MVHSSELINFVIFLESLFKYDLEQFIVISKFKIADSYVISNLHNNSIYARTLFPTVKTIIRYFRIKGLMTRVALILEQHTRKTSMAESSDREGH